MAARSGNCGCLGLLLERHRPGLHAAALRLLGYHPEAEDAVHETFLIALQRLGELRDPQSVGAWLHVVLRHCCLQHLRRRKGEVLTAALPEVVDERPSAEEQLDKLALRDWVWGALQRLPEPLRVAALLRYFGSYQSAATNLTKRSPPFWRSRSARCAVDFRRRSSSWRMGCLRPQAWLTAICALPLTSVNASTMDYSAISTLAVNAIVSSAILITICI